MKKILSGLLLLTFFITVALPTQSQEVIELKQPTSNKIIIKLMFRNGSIADPKGKEG
jgi:zinc protease